MKKKLRFTTWLLIFIVVLGFIALRSGEMRSYLVYAQSLNEVVAVVDGQEIDLKKMAFYVAYEERIVQEEALIYDAERPHRYWNIASGGSFIRTKAKQVALDMAIHDAVFLGLAKDAGIVLDEKEEQYLANDQMDFWNDLEEEQKQALGVTREQMDENIRDIALAEKYQYILAEMKQKEFEEYSVSGEAYLSMLTEHEVEINEQTWERVHFGNITVQIKEGD